MLKAATVWGIYKSTQENLWPSWTKSCGFSIRGPFLRMSEQNGPAAASLVRHTKILTCLHPPRVNTNIFLCHSLLSQPSVFYHWSFPWLPLPHPDQHILTSSTLTPLPDCSLLCETSQDPPAWLPSTDLAHSRFRCFVCLLVIIPDQDFSLCLTVSDRLPGFHCSFCQLLIWEAV